MTSRVASAPGKVVLSGEYAVLDRAPAVCMAVDRRSIARVSDCAGDCHRVTAPGYTEVEGRFLQHGDDIEWLQGRAEFDLVDAVLRTIDFAPPTPLSIELDTRAFHDERTGDKVGIGASAALTVALLAALRVGHDVFADSLSAHRRLQHGAGSGVDIAAAVHGGIIEYRMHDAHVAQLRWPAGLYYRLVWTGTPADTREKLARLGKARDDDSSRQLVDAAARMARAWQSADAVLQAYPVYIEQLRRFSVDHNLGIFDAGHDALVTAAADAGLVYKPCGAGGGDVGILLGKSNEDLDEFVTGEIRTLPCHLDAAGVTLERH